MDIKNIIIAALSGVCILLFFSKKTVNVGHSDTLCHSDSILIYKPIQTIKSVEKVSYRWLKSIDTIYQYKVDTLINEVRVDSTYKYVEIPYNEYKDSTVFIRTLGWLDSMAIQPKIVKEIEYKTKPEKYSVFVNGSVGKDFIVPSFNFSANKMQYGVGYNLVTSSWVINFGYRLK